MEKFDGDSAEDGLDFMVDVEGLSWGPHYYQFVASDGVSTTSTPLDAGPIRTRWRIQTGITRLSSTMRVLNLGRVYQAMISPFAFSFMTKTTMTLTT